MTAFCSRILYEIYTFQGCRLLGPPDGWDVAFQEGSLLAWTLEGWHQIIWKDLKLSSHLITSEGKLTCHTDVWSFPRQWGAISIKSGFFSYAETHLVGVQIATSFPEGNLIMCLRRFTGVYLWMLTIQSGFILRQSWRASVQKILKEKYMYKKICHS